MYYYILAVCLAYDVTGNAVNPCMMQESPQYYDTLEQCHDAARIAELYYIPQMKEKYPDAGIVYNTPCGKRDGI